MQSYTIKRDLRKILALLAALFECSCSFFSVHGDERKRDEGGKPQKSERNEIYKREISAAWVQFEFEREK